MSAHIAIPKPSIIVSSQAVFDAVADRPRHHLGDVSYETRLEPAGAVHESQRHSSAGGRLGLWSTPLSLPLDCMEGRENFTITVNVSRLRLTLAAREETTAHRAVWGTDIYTDDSDVVAA